MYIYFFFSHFPPQKVSEKVGGAEGTKLDEEFLDMEKVNPLQSALMHPSPLLASQPVGSCLRELTVTMSEHVFYTPPRTV